MFQAGGIPHGVPPAPVIYAGVHDHFSIRREGALSSLYRRTKVPCTKGQNSREERLWSPFRREYRLC